MAIPTLTPAALRQAMRFIYGGQVRSHFITHACLNRSQDDHDWCTIRQRVASRYSFRHSRNRFRGNNMCHAKLKLRGPRVILSQLQLINMQNASEIFSSGLQFGIDRALLEACQVLIEAQAAEVSADQSRLHSSRALQGCYLSRLP